MHHFNLIMLMSSIRLIRTTTYTSECDPGWIDASSVGLGCLWFDTSAKSYSDATIFCENMDSSLIEIDTPLQMNFTTEKLKTISETAKWQNFEGYQWKAWWGGATDEEKEGTWTWASGKPVESFVWGPGQPSNTYNQDYFCFSIDNRYGKEHFIGNDCSAKNYPLCQKKMYKPNLKEELVCNENWEDASNVGLGYLWFETSLRMNYGNAVTFCKDRNSSLIEINSPEQMNYAIQKLNNISEKVDWNKYYTYYLLITLTNGKAGGVVPQRRRIMYGFGQNQEHF